MKFKKLKRFKRALKKISRKNIIVGVLLLASGLSVAAYREVTRPSSVKLYNEAQDACSSVEGPFKQLCVYMYVSDACQPDDAGQWLDIKICGMIR